MHIRKAGAFRRAVVLATLAPMVFGLLATPAKAHNYYGQKPGIIHCDAFSFKDYTGDWVVEKPTIKFFDEYGNELAAQVSLAVLVDAKLVVCVEVDADADVDIFLDGVLDDNGDGKKDTLVVKVLALAHANADVHVKVKAQVKGKVGLSVVVALAVNLDIDLKAGEKKEYNCKGKDGYDQY